MTADAFQLLSLVAVALLAGPTMVMAGTQKKLLRSKEPPQRCSACGRTGRYNCPCRK